MVEGNHCNASTKTFNDDEDPTSNFFITHMFHDKFPSIASQAPPITTCKIEWNSQQKLLPRAPVLVLVQFCPRDHLHSNENLWRHRESNQIFQVRTKPVPLRKPIVLNSITATRLQLLLSPPTIP